MKGNKRDKIYLFMILPAFIGFTGLFIVPTVMSFFYSMTNWSVYSQEIHFVGLHNYRKLFSDDKTIAPILHSIKYAILITVIQNVFAIVLAVLLNKKSKAANFVKSITFLPAVLSIMVVGYLFQYIMTSADGGLFKQHPYVFRGKTGKLAGRQQNSVIFRAHHPGLAVDRVVDGHLYRQSEKHRFRLV